MNFTWLNQGALTFWKKLKKNQVCDTLYFLFSARNVANGCTFLSGQINPAKFCTIRWIQTISSCQFALNAVRFRNYSVWPSSLTLFPFQDAHSVCNFAFGLLGSTLHRRFIEQSVGRVESQTFQELWEPGWTLSIFTDAACERGYRLFEWACCFQTEMAVRRAAWERNARLVVRHNLEALAGKHGFTLDLNHLADMVRRAFPYSGVCLCGCLATSFHRTVKAGSSSSQPLCIGPPWWKTGVPSSDLFNPACGTDVDNET